MCKCPLYHTIQVTPEMAIAVASVLAAMTLVVLDAAMTNVALPAISQSLGVTPAEAVRVVNGYQLGLLVALLPSAALGGSVDQGMCDGCGESPRICTGQGCPQNVV